MADHITPPDFDFDTRAVRAGTMRTPFNEHSEAVFLTSSFVFDSAAQAAARFAGAEDGYVYSRFTNPTVRMFEQRQGGPGSRGERSARTPAGAAWARAAGAGAHRAAPHRLGRRPAGGVRQRRRAGCRRAPRRPAAGGQRQARGHGEQVRALVADAEQSVALLILRDGDRRFVPVSTREP